MVQKLVAAGFAAGLTAIGLPSIGHAQALDQLGNRASAIGAFVAVADDASAAVWNPAGLVSGPIFSVLTDFGKATMVPDDPVAPRGRAGELTSSLVAAAMPPLGVSFFRTRRVSAQPSPAVSSIPTRHIEEVVVRSVVTSQIGVTVLHSLADGVTVGTTVRLVHGSLATVTTSAASWEDALQHAESIEGRAHTTADVDVGALIARGRMRFGLVARNLATPTFRASSASGGSVTLEREVRLGAAWGDGWPGTTKIVVAVDADLTRVDHPAGERRDIAAGAERWFKQQRVAVRGGVRASTIGDVRPVASGGGSIAIRNGVYVDIYAAHGRERDRRWGIAARLTY